MKKLLNCKYKQNIRNTAAILLLACMPVYCFAQSGPDTAENTFGQTFLPDYTFKGSGLDDWQVVGSAEWQAEEGVLTGRTASENDSGWLIFDRSYQDVAFRALFKCSTDCDTGILLRVEKAGEDMNAIFLSVKDEVIPYRVTIDQDGNITDRERLEYAGGIWYRLAPEREEGQEFRPAGGSMPSRPEPEIDLPVQRPDTGLRPEGWNQIEIFLEGNVLRSFLNEGRETGARIGDGSSPESGTDGYGPIALYTGGSREVRFKNVMIKDILVRETPEELSSPRFRVHRINDMYYSWGADAADFNRDGVMDVVAGPYIYYGPAFTGRTEIYPAIAVGPSQEFSATHIQYTYDFNGDGRPDILRTAFSTTLFINPGDESRRWDSYNVLPGVSQSEVTDFADIDADGIPELVYSGNGSVRYAKPDSSDPIQPWTEYIISEEGYGLPHGIGTGDINGDGRTDILNAYGWWEQPEEIEEEKPWAYHPVAFGRYGHRSTGIGGALMAVYDVNGNGLNDVVTSLNVHGFGLAWFEQQRGGDGEISFVRHMISDDYSAENTGDVTFSQPHGNTFADVDGDGIPDFIVGKRHWTHLDNYYDPDPHGPPVLYWYKTVRDPAAPGGARFEPELIHNRSGAGSEVTAVDINQDGAVDIITSTNRGTFIFWNTPED